MHGTIASEIAAARRTIRSITGPAKPPLSHQIVKNHCARRVTESKQPRRLIEMERQAWHLRVGAKDQSALTIRAGRPELRAFDGIRAAVEQVVVNVFNDGMRATRPPSGNTQATG
jgi:hypothetical protein